MTCGERMKRLGPADEAQIRLLMRLPPARRLQTLLELQALWLDTAATSLSGALRLCAHHVDVSEASAWRVNRSSSCMWISFRRWSD